MKPVLFRCPTTGQLVQHLISDEPKPGDEQRYDTTRCLACGSLHLIDRTTGKALGQKD